MTFVTSKVLLMKVRRSPSPLTAYTAIWKPLTQLHRLPLVLALAKKSQSSISVRVGLENTSITRIRCSLDNYTTCIIFLSFPASFSSGELMETIDGCCSHTTWCHLGSDCGARNEIKSREPIRCRECGHRIMYKERTKRGMSLLHFDIVSELICLFSDPIWSAVIIKQRLPLFCHPISCILIL